MDKLSDPEAQRLVEKSPRKSLGRKVLSLLVALTLAAVGSAAAAPAYKNLAALCSDSLPVGKTVGKNDTKNDTNLPGGQLPPHDCDDIFDCIWICHRSEGGPKSCENGKCYCY
mmetsp:Transcript_21728/g.66871  ORF Transcript_21728/g.66871 Transcript_21728/m.66871 type:complete len:113 (-) Transcript_21728:41-379(-)